MVVAFAGLLCTFGEVVAPVAANAGAIVACPSTITEWRRHHSLGRLGWVWEGYRYTLLSATPQFLVSDGRVLDNGLDRPATFNVTSSISQTYRVAATVGVMSNPQNFLSGSVSVTIEASRTTQVGVSVTTEVPPHSRVIAEYGVEAYAVSYAIEAWQSLNMNGTCEEWGY